MGRPIEIKHGDRDLGGASPNRQPTSPPRHHKDRTTGHVRVQDVEQDNSIARPTPSAPFTHTAAHPIRNRNGMLSPRRDPKPPSFGALHGPVPLQAPIWLDRLCDSRSAAEVNGGRSPGGGSIGPWWDALLLDAEESLVPYTHVPLLVFCEQLLLKARVI